MEQTVQQFQEISEGFKLHISKIGECDNETVKQALIEDLSQLKLAIEKLKTRS